MPTLTDIRIAQLLSPYLGDAQAPPALIGQLSIYLDLLLKWNARTNLTAIRDPEEIVRRHFGESLFAARYLPHGEMLLDLGSGAGFPGLPIQLYRPALQVTLAESQGKKASFLREAVRTLGLPTLVHADRAETLTQRFDIVALRAVDNMEAALAAARALLASGGWLVVLDADPNPPPGSRRYPIPGSTSSYVTLTQHS